VGRLLANGRLKTVTGTRRAEDSYHTPLHVETKERFMKKLIKMKRQPIKAPKTLKADRSIDDIIDALASSESGRITFRVAPKRSGQKRQDKA
jgi:hypothetical protein